MNFLLRFFGLSRVGGLLAVVAGLAVALATEAQTLAPLKPAPVPMHFGQPEPADFEAKNFVADSTAPAVVLCDYGVSQFSSSAGKLTINTERTTRIKILKKAGYEYATVEVPLYHRDEDAETLSNLRGFTYVRGADGKVIKTKLEPSAAFEEKRTNNLKVRKFTLPAVQEGAVIEYSYVVRSTFFDNYQDWTFQHDIPTRWSEYRTSIPQVYRYKVLYQGYVPLTINEMNTGSVSLILANHLSNAAGAGAGMEVGSTALTMSTEQHRWVLQNAPAFREEPYSTTPNDYLPRITFELVGYQMPNEPYKDLTDSWLQKNKVLMASEYFGQAIDNCKFLRPLAQALVAQYTDPAARAAAVRELIIKNVKYDGTNRYHASGPLKKSYELHRGTAADVNLLLIATLREAGLAVVPLLLSTRGHGRVSQEYPLLEQFNYVAALVELPDQKELLLDATDPLLPAGMLPTRCLNKIGHTVPASGEGRWVSLVPGQRYTHYQEVSLALDAQGNISGQVHEEQGGYANREAREKLQQLGEKKYVAELAAAHTGWEIPSFAFKQQTSVGQPLGLNYELRHPATTASTATELYIKPLEVFGEQRNPFQHELRSYPVDMGMMQQEVIRVTLKVPAGYVASLPTATSLVLPDNGGRYIYTASSPTSDTVVLMSRLTLDKPVYSAQEYHALRELYRQMLAKQAEALVIKKAS
jgi:transglutaminase-like putative cysteine protease